ncbi:MAG: DNA polymerase Y family protein, partial [Thermomicrobiales bacterium]|nr:DNA polymerase Y family protein [Thermomicrobiales bacterium]
ADPDPVHPLPPLDLVSETLELPVPTASRDALRAILTRLAAHAFERPTLRERRVRQARLRAELDGGGSWECTATLREPGGRRRVTEALGYRIADLMLAGAVERLTLDLLGLVEIGGWQEGLPGFRARRPRELVEAARALRQRYGASGLYRVEEVEPWSRIPERRAALIAYEL